MNDGVANKDYTRTSGVEHVCRWQDLQASAYLSLDQQLVVSVVPKARE